MTQPPLLDAAALVSAGRAVPQRFRLRLTCAQETGEWHCVELLRLVPRRRIVARIRRGDRELLMKAFIGRRARRYAQRDRRGIRALQRAGVRTPALIGRGRIETGGECLLFEVLADAQPWRVTSSSADSQSEHGQAGEPFEAIMAVLARMHGGGVLHDDPHPENFLRCGRVLYTLDGGGVRRRSRLQARFGGIGRRVSLANLAAFLAAVPVTQQRDVTAALGHYAAARGWTIEEVDLRRLTAQLRRASRRRLKRYLRKTVRESSEFHAERRFDRFLACRREAMDCALEAIIEEPDRYLAAGRMLKAGNSATLATVTMSGRRCVIKRYNIKSPGHWLTRSCRPSRAWRSWQYGNAMQLLGIATARPLALIERRLGPLRRSAYLVMEALPGRDLRALAGSGEALEEATIESLARLFAELHAAGLVHGDTKASNFIVDEAGVSLIDLDAMHAPRSPARLRTALRHDMERFLLNWANHPRLAARIEAALKRRVAVSP